MVLLLSTLLLVAGVVGGTATPSGWSADPAWFSVGLDPSLEMGWTIETHSGTDTSVIGFTIDLRFTRLDLTERIGQ